jgi:hypothetical protein
MTNINTEEKEPDEIKKLLECHCGNIKKLQEILKTNPTDDVFCTIAHPK